MLTKDAAIEHFRYKPPTDETRPKFDVVTGEFIALVSNIYDHLPEGPGKTLALRKLVEARMACNACIANHGQ